MACLAPPVSTKKTPLHGIKDRTTRRAIHSTTFVCHSCCRFEREGIGPSPLPQRCRALPLRSFAVHRQCIADRGVAIAIHSVAAPRRSLTPPCRRAVHTASPSPNTSKLCLNCAALCHALAIGRYAVAQRSDSLLPRGRTPPLPRTAPLCLNTPSLRPRRAAHRIAVTQLSPTLPSANRASPMPSRTFQCQPTTVPRCAFASPRPLLSGARQCPRFPPIPGLRLPCRC